MNYELLAFDTLDFQGICETSSDVEICDLGWISLLYGEITFEDGKQIISEGSPTNCELKAINSFANFGCHGYRHSVEDSMSVFTYRITEEDYENAE